MNKELRLKKRTSGKWSIDYLTEKELAALKEAIKGAPLPAKRELQDLQELLNK